MFKRLFWFLLGGLTVAIGLFFWGGKMADVNYSGSKTALIDASVEKVWMVISDDQPEQESIFQPINMNEFAMRIWKEHIGFGGTVLLEVIDQSLFKYVEVQMTESSFGMTGTWKYELEPQGEKTLVTVTEKSKTEGLFMRSLLNILGRDANMDMHLKAIKKGAESI